MNAQSLFDEGMQLLEASKQDGTRHEPYISYERRTLCAVQAQAFFAAAAAYPVAQLECRREALVNSLSEQNRRANEAWMVQAVAEKTVREQEGG